MGNLKEYIPLSSLEMKLVSMTLALVTGAIAGGNHPHGGSIYSSS